MQSNNLNLEERYKKSEEYKEKLKQLRVKIGIKRILSSFVLYA